MASELLDILKWLDAPGSIPVLVVASTAGVALCFWPRTRRLGAVWLIGVLLTYLLLSLPVVASAIAGGLPEVPRDQRWRGDRLDAVIVFDGDNRRGRAATARQLAAAAHPQRVWLLGDPWMWDELSQQGLSRELLVLETGTPTTRDQIAWVNRYVTDHQSAVAVIASRLQMPRVAALVRKSGRAIPLVVSPADDEPATEGFSRFVPTYLALRISRDALYEHAALRYYRWQGWID